MKPDMPCGETKTTLSSLRFIYNSIVLPAGSLSEMPASINLSEQTSGVKSSNSTSID